MLPEHVRQELADQQLRTIELNALYPNGIVGMFHVILP